MNGEPTPQSSDQHPSTLYDELKAIAKNEQGLPVEEFFQDMQELAGKLPAQQEKALDYNDPEQTRPVIFGSCDVPIAELLQSKQIVDLLAEMSGQSKDGVSSKVRIDWLSSETNREEAERKDRVYLTLSRDQDDNFYWTIGGGRHRLAADIIANKASIRADVISRGGWLEGELGQNEISRVASMQDKSENSEKRRQNLNNGENRVIS